MSLLQAAIGGGFLLVIFLGLFLLIGIPILTTLLMRLYWKFAGKKENNKSAKNYYKDFLPFLSILIFSIIALLLLSYLLFILLDNALPAYGLSN